MRTLCYASKNIQVLYPQIIPNQITYIGGHVTTFVKSLLWPGASQWRIYYHRIWGQLSTTRSNVLKQSNGELQVVVNHNQLRTMASETVDPIDGSHPPLSWAVPPERHANSINQCNLSWTRTCNRSMRGNHLAYVATQGIISSTIITKINF